MPECVEVEIVRRRLERLVTGRRLTGVEILDPRLGHWNGSRGRVAAVRRHGKTLLVELEGGPTLALRLSMSGCLLEEVPYRRIADRPPRLVLDFEGCRVQMLDPRRLGRLWKPRGSLPGWDVLAHRNSSALPEPFEALSRASHARLKSFLMDQRRVAGLGNAYANEILFSAGISPLRRASSLTRRERALLWEAIRRVLSRGLRAGGISMRNFFHPDGTRGRFQNYFRIYRKKPGAPCGRCAGAIRVRMLAQRSTFWCPRCQK